MMTFEDAVNAAPAPVCGAFKPAKQALKSEHRSQVECADPRRLSGSIDLDSCLRNVPGHHRSPRWDYALGYRPVDGGEMAVWVEVHPASTTHVDGVLAKLAWLKQWLKTEAPTLRSITPEGQSPKGYHWLATRAGMHIRPGTPQERRLRAAGLDLPRRVLKLP